MADGNKLLKVCGEWKGVRAPMTPLPCAQWSKGKRKALLVDTSHILSS